MWPEDRSWFVGGDVDLTFTYVGGGADLIRALVTDPRLRAMPAAHGDPHLSDGVPSR
jgi:hypothetical protein